jgi:hypothetical protein
MRKPISRLFIFLPVFLLSFVQANSQGTEKYSRVKVSANKSQFQKLLSKGICFDEIAEKKDSYFIGDFSAKEISLMKEEKLSVTVLIDDLTLDFLKRNKEDQIKANEAMRTGGTPPGFSYGSMGGYLTYTQMVTELDELKTMYPNLITTKASIGNSTEGRQYGWLKFLTIPIYMKILKKSFIYRAFTCKRTYFYG